MKNIILLRIIKENRIKIYKEYKKKKNKKKRLDWLFGLSSQHSSSHLKLDDGEKL